MLGHSRMNSTLLINECLSRKWLVVAPNHRLCPQVNILDGPITDCRDLLTWIHAGHLDHALTSHSHPGIRVSKPQIIAMGTSSGGTMAHSLAWNWDNGMTPSPPIAILDFYGAKDFAHPFWSQPLTSSGFGFPTPPPLTPDIESQIYTAHPIPTTDTISLEGQTPTPSSSSDRPHLTPRQIFAFNQIVSGTVIRTNYPPGSPSDPSTFRPIDPLHNLSPSYPPTCIIHGTADTTVPIEHSHAVHQELARLGARTKMIEVEGQNHTFLGALVEGRDEEGEVWKKCLEGVEWIAGFLGTGREGEGEGEKRGV